MLHTQSTRAASVPKLADSVFVPPSSRGVVAPVHRGENWRCCELTRILPHVEQNGKQDTLTIFLIYLCSASLTTVTTRLEFFFFI